jgi:hypothetical protein
MLKLVITGAAAVIPPFPDPADPDVEVWRDHDGAVAAVGHTVGGKHWMHLPGVASFSFSSSSHDVEAFSLQTVGVEWIVDAYHRTVVPMVLQVHGFEVLHASGIRTPRGVVALCGVKETGKSTLAYALAQRGHSLWTDDAVVLRGAGTSVEALSVPFDVRLRPASAAFFGQNQPAAIRRAAEPLRLNPAPLAVICVLERTSELPAGEVVQVRRLVSADALTAVLPHAYCFSLRDPARKQRMMKQYLRVVHEVPIFRLRFQTGLENLPAMLNALEQAAAVSAHEISLV